MVNYTLSNKAVEDLNDIWNYTFDQWSEEQADNYYNMLLDSCEFVASNPNRGKTYFGIAEDLQGFKAKRHIILYQKIENNKIFVVRILFERMDLKNRVTE